MPRPIITAAVITVMLAGCATGNHKNRETVVAGTAYQAQYRVNEDKLPPHTLKSLELNAKKCQSKVTGGGAVAVAEPELLTRGDLVSVLVGEDKTFSGKYVISRDGTLKLPHLKGVVARGRTVGEVGDELARRLVAADFYRSAPQVSVRIDDFAAASVHVAGAVFEPGTVTVGNVSSDNRDTARQAATGASTDGRTLAAALRASGGIRPDADLSRVALHRDGKRTVLDLRGAMDGRRFADLMLLAGDQIEVPSRTCFQEKLMAPSPLTAPGVKVFISNLTKPADANALSAIGKDARELRYGTRFVQAVVGMNCVGGARSTNANRYAVLFSRNPITGESIVIERSIEDMMERADRDELDPYILPGDAIACYDSTVTNITEIARAITGVIGASIPLLAL